MPNKPQIIRKQIIMIDSLDEDEYGNVIVTDKEGNEYKIAAKRKALTENMVNGHAYELGWANYMNRDYIAEVNDVGDKLPPEQPQAHVSQVPVKKGDSRNRSMAIAYAKDLVVAGKLETTQMFALADKIIEWIER